MNLNLVINQIRQHCPSFGGRVAGAAEFFELRESANLKLPSAYVLHMADEPSENSSLNDVRQRLMESFAVIVCVDNRPDERGQAASNTAHNNIRAELWMALLGWCPDKTVYNGAIYQGGHLMPTKKDRARLWYQFDFGAEMFIGPEDSWQAVELAALPHFDGMNIKVDHIDPAADPNLQYPGPDGRIEHEFNVLNRGTCHEHQHPECGVVARLRRDHRSGVVGIVFPHYSGQSAVAERTAQPARTLALFGDFVIV